MQTSPLPPNRKEILQRILPLQREPWSSPPPSKGALQQSSPFKGSPATVLPLQKESCNGPPLSKGALQHWQILSGGNPETMACMCFPLTKGALQQSSPFEGSPVTVLQRAFPPSPSEDR